LARIGRKVEEARMSTTISQGSKLEGFSLYAPRRAREGQTPDCEPAAPPTSQEPQSDPMQEPESKMREPDDDWMESTAEQDDWNEAEPDAVEDRLEHAIREAVAFGRRSDTDDTEDAPTAGVGEHDEVSRSLPVAFSPRYRADRQNRGEVQTSRPGRGSQICRRLRSLEPEIVPEPRAQMPQNGAVGPLMRFLLVVMSAAVVAYGVTKLSSLQLGDGWIQSASDRVGSIASGLRKAPLEQTPQVESLSRLVVGDQQAFTNEPLPLTVVVEHPRQDEVLLLTGLVAGTRLSAGASTGASTWQLSPDKLKGLNLYPPKDFVGVMNTAMDLIGADNRLLDSRAIQLKWIPKQTNPARAPASPPVLADVPAPAAATVLAPAPAQAAEPATVLATTGDPIGVGAPRPTAVEPIDPGEVDFLMQQGRQDLTGGDISAARVAFRRLADAGNAEAALTLAETYDPFYLAQHNVIGLSGDRATAKELYERAKELGSTEAGRMLARLSEQ
jgi:hypothetical protein